MDSLLDRYKTKTLEIKKSRIEAELKHEERVKTRASAMSKEEHAELIEDIILSHAGGKEIIVEYGVPLSLDVRQWIVEHFREIGWNALSVSTCDEFCGLTVGNCHLNVPEPKNSPKYSEFSYRRFRIKIGSDHRHQWRYWKLDFDYQNLDHRDDLVLFSHHIRVNVYNLQVPIERICYGGFDDAERMSYNQGFNYTLDRDADQ